MRAACFLALLIAFAGARAQTNTGSISGTVRDASGAAVVGATVTATNPATSFSQKATTNEDGVFIFAQLPPGRYVIAVEKQGFKKTDKDRRHLESGGPLERW